MTRIRPHFAGKAGSLQDLVWEGAMGTIMVGPVAVVTEIQMVAKPHNDTHFHGRNKNNNGKITHSSIKDNGKRSSNTSSSSQKKIVIAVVL